MERVVNFDVVGQLLGFIIKDGTKIKYLRVVIEDQEYWIKPSKELRNSLTSDITPGCWLKISGTQKIESGKLNLKADSLEKIQDKIEASNKAPGKIEKPKEKMTVLMCEKSSCWKRGGEAVCRAIKESLGDRDLEERVTIKGTGCMKECKAGPNLVIMPDKTRYSRVKPEEVPTIIQKHLINVSAKVEV